MPVKVTGPDQREYQFPDGTDKAAAIAYFKKKGIGATAPEPPGFVSRLGEATGFPTSREQWQAAQPTMAEKIGGPAMTAGKMALNYGRNLVSEGKKDLRMAPVPPTGNFLTDINNAPLSRFMLRGVLGPVGGTGVANLGEDVEKGNYTGAGGDLLGTLINAFLLKKSFRPAEKTATNRLTAAAGKEMHVPIENTLPELRKSGSASGISPQSLEDFYSVASNAAKTIQRESDGALAPIATKQIIPNSIAANIKKLITSDMVKTPEGRAEIAHINAEARKFENQPWSYEQLDSKRMRLNAELNTFEKKGAGARYTAAKGNLNTAIDKAIADTIRDVVYPQMDVAAGKPQGYFRALKQKQGNLMQLSDELNPRNAKSRTASLKAQTAEIQGGSRFSRENMSMHMGGSGVPRASIYGLTNVIRKRNPLAAANKRVRMGFSTGSPTAKGYTGTLPFRQTLFPPPQSEENR